jgi:hypothetical protein
MPTITITVVEHPATERKVWRVTAHDGTHRFTMPVIVGEPISVTDITVARGLVRALGAIEGNQWHPGAWISKPDGLTKGGHRRYRVTY